MTVQPEEGGRVQGEGGSTTPNYRQTPPIGQPYVPKRKGPDTLLIAVVAIIVALAIIIPLLFVPWESVSATRSDSIPADPSVMGVRLDAECGTGHIDVRFHDGGELLTVEVDSDGVKSLLAPDLDIELEIEHDTIMIEGVTWLDVEVRVDTNEDLGRYWIETDCVISIERSMIMDIKAETTLGGVNMTAPDSVEFRNIDLRTTTGSTKLILSPGTIVNGTVSMSTTTGSCDIEWDNVVLLKDVHVEVMTTTGSVAAEISQDRLMGANLTMDMGTTTGYIELHMDIAGDVSATIVSDVGLGGIEASTTGFDGPDDELVSDGHPGVNTIGLTLDTSTGGVGIYATYAP